MEKKEEHKLKEICEKVFEQAWYKHKTFSKKMTDSMDEEFEVCSRVILSLYELGYLNLEDKTAQLKVQKR